jgi:hypothetical protein
MYDLSLALPHTLRYKEFQSYISFKGRGNQTKWLAQSHKRGGPWWILNPWCSNLKSDPLTTRSCLSQ